MVNNISVIKAQVKALYNEHQKIHMDITFKGDRKHLTNISAQITAVYPNIFAVKSEEDGGEKAYTFRYADVFTHNVEIKELNGAN